MKKLLLISTLVSLAWGQVCSIDGSQMVKLSGETPRPDGNGNYAYLFECDPMAPNPKHQRWIVEQKQNSYQPQQQTQQQSRQRIPPPLEIERSRVRTSSLALKISL